MIGMDARSQTKLYAYYGSIGKHLERNNLNNTLYEFQLLMKDYVRAFMNCVSFFNKMCRNYCDLYANLDYLVKARTHLEQYMETYSGTSHQQQLRWKHRQEQPSLIKHITPQETDK